MVITANAVQHAGSGSEWFLSRLRVASGDTSSSEAITTIRSWIDKCMNEHEVCQAQDQPRAMPARVLRLDRDYVELCENMGQSQPYACLSHCWGVTGPKLKLTAKNVASMRAGLPITQLPKTFRDAVKVSLNIGIQYLWIDALCILQDNLKDWHSAAASMADIYAGAVLTLAATWSNDSECGLFSRMQDHYRSIPLQEPGLFARYALPDFPRTAGSPAFECWPLLTRAWVFQERRLSARVLHFGAEQLHWECNAAVLSEAGGDDNEWMSSGDFKFIPKDSVTAWREAVEHYSKLELTYEKDRLPAISAVVKRMQATRKNDVYVAGMWQNSLLEDLSWQISLAPRSRARGNLPTWSWISVPNQVGWSERKALQTAALIKTNFTIIGPSHFGHAINPSVTIKGPTCSIKVTWDTSSAFTRSNCKVQELAPELRDARLLCGILPDFDWTVTNFGIERGDCLTTVILWGDPGKYEHSVTGLLLKAVGNGQYQRMGLLELSVYIGGKNYFAKELLDQYISSLPIEECTIV